MGRKEAQVQLKDHSVSDYLSKLASQEPAPGGGSASALVACSGISLGQMVAGILLKRKNDPEKQEQLQKLHDVFKNAVSQVEKVIDSDAVVYEDVVKAYETDKKGDERKQHIDQALTKAYEEMYDLAHLLKSMQANMDFLEELGNQSIMNDVKVGRAFIEAGFEGAYATSNINVECIYDQNLRSQLEEKLKKLRG